MHLYKKTLEFQLFCLLEKKSKFTFIIINIFYTRVTNII